MRLDCSKPMTQETSMARLDVRDDVREDVARFCLLLEGARRDGSVPVRSSREFLNAFFPHDERGFEDCVFLHLPKEVRGPIVSGWELRGPKVALADDDGRIARVVYEALLAGDIGEATFEAGLAADILTTWVPLPAWWQFWRGGHVDAEAARRALTLGRELGLFDDRWFLDRLQSQGGGRSGPLRGTDAICEALMKQELTAWLCSVARSGVASPAGLVEALGWGAALAALPIDALHDALDALASESGLAPASAGPVSRHVGEVPIAPALQWPPPAPVDDMAWSGIT